MEAVLPLNPIDELLPVIAKAVIDWQVEHSPESIKRKVNTLLGNNSEEIVLKLLGFNKDRYEGNWSLDHCNGRSGESAAGDYLRNTQADAIKEWLNSIPMPTLTPKMLSSFKKQYQDEFNQRVNYQIQKRIQQEAQSKVDALFNDIACSTQLDNFIKTMNLISPKGISDAS